MKLAACLIIAVLMALPAQAEKARAVLKSASGRTISGTVNFSGEAGRIAVDGKISGLTPGEHGFHIHEKGDCSSDDFSSAGAHFNPGHAKHGGPATAERHEGDLGNITADTSGSAAVSQRHGDLQLSGSTSIIGRSIVVHEKADDLKSDPSGNSGARIACGVIEAVQ